MSLMLNDRVVKYVNAQELHRKNSAGRDAGETGGQSIPMLTNNPPVWSVLTVHELCDSCAELWPRA